jgi:tetratricopeptide (TPR) repeat protein
LLLLDPHRNDIRLHRAGALKLLHNRQSEAATEYEAIIAIDNGAGRSLQAEGKKGEEEEEGLSSERLSSVERLHVNVEVASAWFNYGSLRQEQRRHAEAEHCFRAVLSTRGPNGAAAPVGTRAEGAKKPSFFHNRFDDLLPRQARDKRKEDRAAAQRGIELRTAMVHLASVLTVRGRREIHEDPEVAAAAAAEAGRLFDDALRLAPGNPTVLVNRANGETGTGTGTGTGRYEDVSAVVHHPSSSGSAEARGI